MDTAADPSVFTLPGEFSIYSAADTHAALRQWLAGLPAAPAALRLEAGEVFEVDGSGVQLLLATEASLQAQGRDWQFGGVSDTLAQALADLGLADWLSCHRAAATVLAD
ncbi:MAG: hypothetical protein RL722_2143 [Pseudomonadota bacterium]|jgi:anti-anti-sigma regulatory factor